ncbi:hypothetical protein ACFWR9_14985 [Streptomyces sp. NPDC058534]|uniref:hypothetical protein n=1 Tax=Streptomyces sp. NPDC058534 TaxID=3346541 RepID=UPI003666A0EA
MAVILYDYVMIGRLCFGSSDPAHLYYGSYVMLASFVLVDVLIGVGPHGARRAHRRHAPGARSLAGQPPAPNGQDRVFRRGVSRL